MLRCTLSGSWPSGSARAPSAGAHLRVDRVWGSSREVCAQHQQRQEPMRSRCSPQVAHACDRHGVQAQLLHQRVRGRSLSMDELCTKLNRMGCCRVPAAWLQRACAAADGAPSLQHQHLTPGVCQAPRCRQAGMGMGCCVASSARYAGSSWLAVGWQHQWQQQAAPTCS